jgi:hypothetical protein
LRRRAVCVWPPPPAAAPPLQKPAEPPKAAEAAKVPFLLCEEFGTWGASWRTKEFGVSQERWRGACLRDERWRPGGVGLRASCARGQCLQEDIVMSRHSRRRQGQPEAIPPSLRGNRARTGEPARREQPKNSAPGTVSVDVSSRYHVCRLT